METPENEKNRNPTAEDIRKISEKHINSIPNGHDVPDMPATGGRQFSEDGNDENAEKTPGDLKP